MNLIFVHGNSADPSGFHFIDGHLDAYTRIYLSYDSANGFANNLQQMKQALADVEGDVILVGHSLGGIYCLFLSKYFGERCKGAITLATPFNGCECAVWMSLFSNKRVLKDVSPRATAITSSLRVQFNHPWLAVVPMLGHNPMMMLRNDGRVSHSSMTCRDDMLHVEVEEDHYSVLKSQDVVEIVKNFIKRACKQDKKVVL